MSAPPSPSTDNPHDVAASPRADLIGGVLWLALGAAIALMSWRMDRLQAQHINPYTVPGLVPGMLGLAMLVLGFLLATRGWRAGGRLAAATQPAGGGPPPGHGPHAGPAVRLRIVLVLALCLTFGVGLVGHGLPFWAAAALFVAVAVLVLQAPWRRAAGSGLGPRTVLVAIAIGLGAGVLITVVFQDLFLVHLP